MGEMPPPGENIGLIEDLIRETMLGFVERSGAHHEIPLLLKGRGDRLMHALRVERGDPRIFLFVTKFTPDRDANGGGGR